MLGYLFFGMTYGFAAAVQPGPFQTYLLSQTVKMGWRRAFPAAFAPIMSDAPIILLVLFVLRNFSDLFICILRIGGGFFLLYLGIRAFLSWKRYDPEKAFLNESGSQTFFNAVMVNLLNPNPYVGWSLILGPLFLEGWRSTPINGISLITGFYVTLTVTLIGTVILFAFARGIGPRVCKILLGLSAFALIAFGVFQLWLGLLFFINRCGYTIGESLFLFESYAQET